MDIQEIAQWAYIIFVVVAILAGLILGYSAYDSYLITPTDPPVNWAENIKTNDGYVLFAMLLLGSVIGLTSITRREVSAFLIATVALLVASGANVWAGLWYLHPILFFWASAILSYIVAFAAPAAVIISIKSVLTMAKEK
ncbi:MAG: hypothetical protein CW691_04225 [Candidatus Bathyarchaeum sp.]|nr:MAG: hypothetical protein CW691_04225 [Candidatus Bathyarchaeum sp.]